MSGSMHAVGWLHGQLEDHDRVRHGPQRLQRQRNRRY